MAKTVQSLKIAASWTPSQATADAMMTAGFTDSLASGVRFAGGRLALRHAIKIDFADPAQAARVSDRVAEIKEALGYSGTLHGFTTTAGAVPVGQAEDLDPPEKDKAEGDETDLPAGWSVEDGVLIVPEVVDKKPNSLAAMQERGQAAIVGRYARIMTTKGRSIKEPDAE